MNLSEFTIDKKACNNAKFNEITYFVWILLAATFPKSEVTSRVN